MVATETSPPLLSLLTPSQQLELIYIAYFNRAADGGGDVFWTGQNVQAQDSGQSAAVALTNIANSFEPQPETIALYPFLATPNLDLNSPSVQVGLGNFIDSVYGNMFGHSADAAGKAYWVGQIKIGAVGLGAAALAIANGATSADAIELQNKITVSLDFTSRTEAVGLGEIAPLPAAFLSIAKFILVGVDGGTLNDSSVTAAESATSNYIIGAAPSHQSAINVSPDPNVITIGGSNQVIDPGAGDFTIQFLAGTRGDSLVPHLGGVDQVSGFDSGTDVLDFHSLLAEANVALNGDIAALGHHLTITNQSGDALLTFDPTGHGGGATVAVLHGQGGVSLDALIARGAIRVA